MVYFEKIALFCFSSSIILWTLVIFETSWHILKNNIFVEYFPLFQTQYDKKDRCENIVSYYDFSVIINK